MRRLYTESAEMSSDEFEDWLHEIFDVETLVQLDLEEDAALGIIEDELKRWFGGIDTESNEKGGNLNDNENQGISEPDRLIETQASPRELTTTVNNSVVSRPRSTPSIFGEGDLNEIINAAQFIARSGIFTGIDTVDKAVTIMLKGLSMKINPMDALDGFDVITDKMGKVKLYPRVKLLLALVNQTGTRQRFEVVGDSTHATATVQRIGQKVQTFTFTLAQAKQMGLTEKYNWSRFPDKMLVARATGMAINAVWPEVNYSFGQNVVEAVDGIGDGDQQ